MTTTKLIPGQLYQLQEPAYFFFFIGKQEKDGDVEETFEKGGLFMFLKEEPYLFGKRPFCFWFLDPKGRKIGIPFLPRHFSDWFKRAQTSL